MKAIFAISFLVAIVAATAIAGEVEDIQLRESALKLDIIGVETALEQGANPNVTADEFWTHPATISGPT